MKLLLTSKQIETLLYKNQINGDKAKTAWAKALVGLGLFAPMQDEYGTLQITQKGNEVSAALYQLTEAGVL